MAIARYWRLNITATGGQPPIVDSMQLRNSAAGPNLAIPGNGTASASSVSAGAPENVAANAFDATGAYWKSNTSGTGWLQWDFGEGIDVNHLRLVNFSGTTTCNITAGSLDYSNDLASWTKLITLVGMNAGASATNDKLPDPRGVANLAIPLLSVSVFPGGSLNIPLPSFTSSVFGGSKTTAQLPAPTLLAAGHNSYGEDAAILSLPSLGVTALGGANLHVSLPGFTAVATSTVAGLASADIALPALSASVGGTVAGLGALAINLPGFTSASYSGALCSITIGAITTQATGATGGVGRAQITLPLFEATAMGTQQNYGELNITLPMFGVDTGARAQLTLPSFNLTAIGTAVVTATYEAYALNLNHNDPAAVDEMTRYTNFPFTHVVRYKNSYFGVNETGLYLLEGTTDHADPEPTAIPWAFKTTLTDFKSPFIKTVVSTYFAGRMGPDAAIDLYVGEDGAKTYSYQTPRTSTAKNFRQKFGRGNDARYYALGASGDGELALDEIQFNTLNHTRRI